MDDWNVSYMPDADLGLIAGYGVRREIQFQHGPVDDAGHNGVQNEQVIELLCVRLRSQNEKFPCRENAIALTHLETALLWLNHRTALRRKQGVEGKNEAHIS